jgi:4-amino-4-deoxy-L-arabinose transferase-like glycosyltransferase
MKYTVLSVTLICFLLACIFSLGVGFYAKDFVFLVIGGLLIFASLLISYEIKKIKNDPFH